MSDFAIVSSSFQVEIDAPAAGQNVYDTAIFISGAIHGAEPHGAKLCLRAYVGDYCAAETRIFTLRSDGARGFRMLGKMPPVAEAGEKELQIVATVGDGAPITVAERMLRIVPASLPTRPHGGVVSPDNETLLRRENIYGSGPPLEQPGLEVAGLIGAHLPDGASVVDVGCGAGAYGPALRAAGHEWLGLESNSHCCQILERRELPFRRVDPRVSHLPCSDAEWDAAICIEVLEHIEDARAFVAEIARIIRGRALFSVPNLEILPYLHDWGVVPWHLLEADHRNFFTRASLRVLLARSFRTVEIFSYGEHQLRTREGIPLHVHLFAIADK
ncbi:MAG TPA: class I SAM-dependent methyltransferase [Chthoniobacterales bacterium]|nr:class I SAM-dependent methyltransferase [Chthoniobacterales bacterium]